ncbi:MAG: type II secretion system F family protein, partial [Candidatus Omnitrophica bacterium]|nr:type II secretion system F family protein [Candidatus Omnitrophota bacterium]
GKLDELLTHVSDYYDAQVDYTINNLVSLIEPLLIFFLGCAVLIMALGIFMPMWSMMKLFKH